MKFRKITLTLLFLFSIFSNAQNKSDVEKIVKEYDVEKIQQKIENFKLLEQNEKKKAYEAATKNGWPLTIKGTDGSYQELMKLTPDGFPIYYSTNNANAAKSTRAIHLNSGGSLGLNLNGQGMVARVWDGGTVRRTHNFFSGRVTTVDDVSGTTYAAHATHVTGTIIADASFNTSIRGMAYQATARTFEWTDDESEALSEVLGGMLISNHSYGVPITSSGTSLPAWYIGAYTLDAANWDEITYLSPYYLPVMSAGNDGTNNNNTNPIATGFDKLTGNKTSKNALIIANANDANVATDGTLISVTINNSSSQGPTDDLRIKPDITGNGTSLTSTNSTSNTSTTTMTGTSMSSPNVAGTLLLLQQHHKNLTSSFMKSATLKGLACHTADDAGNAGPDAKFGWGLLNAKKAAEALTNNGLTSWVSEENLAQGQTYNMSVNAIGGSTNPLMASITWTDLPGTPNNGNSGDNDPTPSLVNDLDIRVTKNGTVTYYPWKLQSNPNSLAIRTGDNNVDNVEVIKIDVPVAGIYDIAITHKGALVNNSQKFSLVITGITSDFSLTSKSDDLIVCTNQNAVYTFDYKQIGSMTTNFTAVGLPLGATASFSPTSLGANGTVTMTVSNLSTVQPGDYSIGIKGDNGTETETRLKGLKVYSSTFQNTTLNTPVNGQNTVPTTVSLKWNSDINVESYNLQVSTSPVFATFYTNINTIQTTYSISGLSEETVYYWRVIPSNRCGNALTSNANVFNFETGKLTCGSTFTGTDFSNATIGTTANSIATVPINVTGGLLIGDLNVTLDITHTYIQDMKYYLEGPVAIGSPIVTLFSEPCGDNDDIACTLDDAGVVFTCGTTAPSISGTVKPFENLSNFNSLSADGTWILRVVDAYNGDGGAINAVSLSFCNIEQSLSSPSNALSSLVIYPNPSKGIVNINLNRAINGETTYTLYDIQGRKIVDKKSNTSMETLNVQQLNDGIYLLSVKNGDLESTHKIVVKK